MQRALWVEAAMRLAVAATALVTGCVPVRGRVSYVGPSGYVTQPAQVTVYAEPPPPPQAVVQPVAPGPDYVWIDGHWAWNDAWTWQPGEWILSRPGYVWTAPVVVRAPNGRYAYHRGYWRPHDRQPPPVYRQPSPIRVTVPPRRGPSVVVQPPRRQPPPPVVVHPPPRRGPVVVQPPPRRGPVVVQPPPRRGPVVVQPPPRRGPVVVHPPGPQPQPPPRRGAVVVHPPGPQPQPPPRRGAVVVHPPGPQPQPPPGQQRRDDRRDRRDDRRDERGDRGGRGGTVRVTTPH